MTDPLISGYAFTAFDSVRSHRDAFFHVGIHCQAHNTRIETIKDCCYLELAIPGLDFRNIRHTLSEWLERVVLIAMLEPNRSLLRVISPPNPLNPHEQVKAKIPIKCLYFSKQIKGNLWLCYGFGRSPIGNRATALSK